MMTINYTAAPPSVKNKPIPLNKLSKEALTFLHNSLRKCKAPPQRNRKIFFPPLTTPLKTEMTIDAITRLGPTSFE